MLLYVGIENALGGWLPSYAIRVNPSAHAPTIALYFWIAQLVGRLLMAAPTNLLGEAALYRLSLAVLILTQALVLATGHLAPGSMVVLTILSGFALAPLYPLILAFLFARTGSHPRLGPLFASASLGGATCPGSPASSPPTSTASELDSSSPLPDHSPSPPLNRHHQQGSCKGHRLICIHGLGPNASHEPRLQSARHRKTHPPESSPAPPPPQIHAEPRSNSPARTRAAASPLPSSPSEQVKPVQIPSTP